MALNEKGMQMRDETRAWRKPQQRITDESHFIDVRTVASRAGIPKSKIRLWFRKGQIPCAYQGEGSQTRYLLLRSSVFYVLMMAQLREHLTRVEECWEIMERLGGIALREMAAGTYIVLAYPLDRDSLLVVGTEEECLPVIGRHLRSVSGRATVQMLPIGDLVKRVNELMEALL